MTPPSISMLIEAIARRDADPLTRFVRSLPDDEPFRLRSYAEETIRLQHEFLSNAQRMLTATAPREATLYAEWVSKHAHEVAYRWACLRASVTRWSMLDTESLSIVFGETGTMKLSKVQRILTKRLAWLTAKADESPLNGAIADERDALSTILRCQSMLDPARVAHHVTKCEAQVLPAEQRTKARAPR